MGILTAGDISTPRIVSEDDLRRTLAPVLALDPWAADTIGDLWRKGAPVLQKGPAGEEMRILLPLQFAAWWRDVASRLGAGIGTKGLLDG